ncbi:MAG: hypothetical protein KAR20_15615 [Candidatus Heimdallarchaeota archaeon]|nr:hypothetical protein [Candidatus Heimdallarchaeota archaeon]
MKIRSIEIKNFFIPETFMGNDKAPAKEKLKIIYKRRPTAGEIGTYTTSYFKDDVFYRDRHDNKAVLEYVEKIENLELDDKSIETAEGLVNAEVSALSVLITLIANDLLIPNDFEMGED